MNARPVRIAEGFTTDDIKTLKDCDRAHLLLTDGIAKVQAKLGNPDYVQRQNAEWPLRARSALRHMRAGLQIVQSKRRDIRDQHVQTWTHRFVEHVKSNHPQVYASTRDAIAC